MEKNDGIFPDEPVEVAVNTLEAGYDTYGSYLFPPFKNRMYAGNFWWAKASGDLHASRLMRSLKKIDEFAEFRFFGVRNLRFRRMVR